MFQQDIVGRKLNSGHMLVISDYAWNEAGSFCRIIWCDALDVLSESSYTVSRPYWLVVGNRPTYEGHPLEAIELPLGGVMYWGMFSYVGSQFSRISAQQFAAVAYYDHVPEYLDTALSWIGLHDDDLACIRDRVSHELAAGIHHAA